jgi:hypothetical protein
MKRILLISVLILSCFSAYSQKSIERIFDKYASEDGYVTFSLSGNLLSFSSCENDNNSIPSDISTIRIIAREKNTFKDGNFIESVFNSVKSDDYEEFMKIKNSENDVRIFVRTRGKTITELLLVTAGEDNALIQFKGNITFSEAKRLSKDIETNHVHMTGLNSQE